MVRGDGIVRRAKSSIMIIESSDQVSRLSWLKRFPIPRNFKVTPESRIETGRTWPVYAGAKRMKAFEIYRYDPDSGANPRLLGSVRPKVASGTGGRNAQRQSRLC